MRAFLGQAGFCRPWILGYSELIKPLTETTREQAVEPIPWTDELQTAFPSVKQALMSAPALGLPDYSKPFYLYVTEMSGHAKGVLTQKPAAAELVEKAPFTISFSEITNRLCRYASSSRVQIYACDCGSSIGMGGSVSDTEK
uniref:Reverse transcriptase/retrotransposon-derived protein RNase H-like domain-containing protein n=1 Tax=Phasianus colchicus TaxID=9054 RepID=A0A669QIP1_PHACC